MYAVCLSVCLCGCMCTTCVWVHQYICNAQVLPCCICVSQSCVCIFYIFLLSLLLNICRCACGCTDARARACVCVLGTTHRLASQQALFVSTGISFIGYMYLVTNSHLYYTLSWRCYCGSNASRPSKCLLHTVVEEQQKVSNTDRHTDNVRRGLHSRPVASSHSDATHTISSHH